MKRMNTLSFCRSIIWTLLLVPGIIFAKEPSYRLSYEQCVAMALRNNDQIRAADRDIAVSAGKLEETHPRGIPVLKYEQRLAPAPRNIDDPGESFFNGEITVFNSVRVEAGSPISTFGKIKTAQALASIGVDASWLKKKKTSDEVALKIYQTYEGIYLAQDLLALSDEANKTIQGKVDELTQATTKDQLGILKLRMANYEVERQVQEAKKRKELAYSALKLLVGLEDNVILDVKPGTLAPVSFKIEPLEHYLDTSRNYLPDFKLIQAGVNAKEQKLKLEKLDPAPSLGLGGFVDLGRAPYVSGAEKETNFTNPFNYTRAGIGFQLKGEFNYVQHKARLDQAKADLLKTIYEKRAAVGGLELDIKKTYLDLLEAKTLMNQAGTAKKDARQMMFLTKSNLDVGIGEKKDYLDSVQSYLIFSGRELEAIYNYNVAVAALKQRIGSLYKEQKEESGTVNNKE